MAQRKNEVDTVCVCVFGASEKKIQDFVVRAITDMYADWIYWHNNHYILHMIYVLLSKVVEMWWKNSVAVAPAATAATSDTGAIYTKLEIYANSHLKLSRESINRFTLGDRFDLWTANVQMQM